MVCARCGMQPAPAAVALLLPVPDQTGVPSPTTKGVRRAHTVLLDEQLCAPCGALVLKLLKRVLPTRLLRIE